MALLLNWVIFNTTTYSKFIPNSKLRMGLIPTPLFAFPEKVWGYRSVEKEALDLRGFGNSSDQGASLEGNFDKNGNSGFTAMIGNGSGNKPIANKYLEYYLSVHKRFFDKKLNVELMMDYKRLNTEQERILFRTFGSYELPNFRFGVEISPNSFDQTVKIGTESQVVQTKPFLGSTFAAAKLHKNSLVICTLGLPESGYKL
ncbi:MAG: hypothetical protein U5K51_12930 [Flavobacteriaceae bacterium]|nr:hypothetical protein [Flavobacteriaceae bacterium]